MSKYKNLFDHLSAEHGLTLLDSEMQEIFNIVEKESELMAVIENINNTIYAAGAPLGSANYFLIRELCCDAINGEKQKEKPMPILTSATLKMMEGGHIIASGEIINDESGVFMVNDRKGEKLGWVAKRGDGYWDWAIYVGWANQTVGDILANGQKVCNDDNIQKLVPCTEAALKLYRK